MGQQQLLLLVLGIVIVGLAVVVGINAFGENQKRANADALVNDGLRIASDLQAYALKPAQFGGSGGFGKLIAEDPDDDFFRDGLGYSLDSDGNYTNVNGRFTFEDATDTGGIVIQGENADQSNVVQIRVCGVTSREILTAISYEGSGSVIAPDPCPGDAPDEPET